MPKATPPKLKRAPRVAILGFGREGQSLLRFLRSRGLTRLPVRSRAKAGTEPRTRADEIWILDRNPEVRSTITIGESSGVRWQVGAGYLRGLSRFDVIFRSPGVPYTLPQLGAARKAGVEISSATKLFFEEARRAEPRRPRLIGITGSKGKGTTATLLCEIMRESGFRVLLGGNIGAPMLDLLSQAGEAPQSSAAGQAEWIILELSSFQLQDLKASPEIAVVLDVFPEHLDVHRTLREYLAAKAGIARYQTNRDRIFYFNDSDLSRKIAMRSVAQKTAVNPMRPGVGKNYDMAAAVARHLECPETVIARVTRDFKGLPHRLELVRTIEVRARYSNVLKNMRITFYDDSTATNPHAAAAAIRTFTEPVVLIAGGRSKGLDPMPLVTAIRESPHVRAVVLMGENREELRKAISATSDPPSLKLRRAGKRPFDATQGKQATGRNSELEVVECGSLKSAVSRAYAIAKLTNARTHELVTILFSPGAASFDMFRNMYERGDAFKKIVRALRAGR